MKNDVFQVLSSLLRSCNLRKPPHANDVQPKQDGDSPFDDFFASEMGDQARQELEAAAAEDAAALYDQQHEGDSVPNQNQDPDPNPPPSEPPARRRRVEDIPENSGTIYVKCGISEVVRVKRAGVKCMHCSMPIPKGDVRFEYVWKRNRPPRSIHTMCLNQLDEQSCASSIGFLETLLSQNPPNDSEELQACRAALRTLKGMMEVYNVV